MNSALVRLRDAHIPMLGQAQVAKNLPAVQETWLGSLGQEDPLEKGMATHSSILAWRIPGERSLTGYSPRVTKSQTQLSD